ncbi:MAG: hypothetical protein J07HR59_01353 [Halorubrum sp. J07HR59]|nr:MAG: hypothetical protein J07HR59_01353 [Halorubrum sp. J07HR59]
MIPTRTQRDPAAYRRNCCVSPSEGCGPARSLRPHRNRNRNRNPCHRCATHRESAAPCGSGPASHRFRRSFSCVGPHQPAFGRTSQSLPVRGLWPLRPRDLRPAEDGRLRSPLYQNGSSQADWTTNDQFPRTRTPPWAPSRSLAPGETLTKTAPSRASEMVRPPQ